MSAWPVDFEHCKLTVIFDASCPFGVSQEEHFIGFFTPENLARSMDHGVPKGLNGYLLDLADACKGFRALVVGPTLANIMKRYVKEFVVGVQHRTVRTGTWRGYPVYVDETLDAPPMNDSDYPRVLGRFVTTASGPTLGLVSVINWGGFEW